MNTLTTPTSTPIPSLKAVIFDWAGTIVDFGCHAPMAAFVKLFLNSDITISISDARGPMGLPKWDHIEAICRLPHVDAQWHEKFGRSANQSDIDRLYQEFIPINAESILHHSQLIPGFVDLQQSLREQGYKLGTTTGYNRELMKILLAEAQQQGFVPDSLTCSDDLKQTRPGPLGMYKSLIELDTWPAHHVVKVDDTVPGLLEGYHAGCWTVGVVASGNEVGLTREEWERLSAKEQVTVRTRVKAKLEAGYPDYFIDTIAELPQVLQEINLRLMSSDPEVNQNRSQRHV